MLLKDCITYEDLDERDCIDLTYSIVKALFSNVANE